MKRSSLRNFRAEAEARAFVRVEATDGQTCS